MLNFIILKFCENAVNMKEIDFNLAKLFKNVVYKVIKIKRIKMQMSESHTNFVQLASTRKIYNYLKLYTLSLNETYINIYNHDDKIL